MHAAKIIVLILGAIVARRFVDWAFLDPLAISLIGLLIAAFVWSRLSLREVRISREIATDRLQVGETLRDRIRIQNDGRLAKLWLEMLDYSTLPGHSASRVVHVRGRREADWTAETVCARRGRYRTGPTVLHSGDPFGFFPVTLRVPISHELIVYPAVVNLASYQLPAGNLIGGGIAARRNPFVSPSVIGIREYVQGDALNRISWTASARLGRLVVKEFDLDPSSDVWIVLDLERRHHRSAKQVEAGRVPGLPLAAPWMDSTEEYGVAIAASLTKRCLDDGRAVGLIASSAQLQLFPPDRTDRQLRKVLESLAVIQSDGQQPLQELLLAESHRFRKQSAVIVISPSPDEAWAAALSGIASRRIPSAAILVEASTFGSAPSPLIAMSGLVAAGVQTHLVKLGDDISIALSGATGAGSHRGRGAPRV